MHYSNYKIFYFINDFKKDHILKLNKNINLIYRNYNKKINKEFLRKICVFCKSKGYKIYLANNFKLALTLNFDGVYIPSFNKQIFRTDSLKKNFKLLGSAHNLKEIKEKEKQKVEFIFLSPLFKKNEKKILGLNKFLILSKKTKIKIVALGGINKNNIKQLNMIKVNQFASISYIKKKYE